MVSDAFGFVGTTLDGKYRIDEVVGEGGFGVVYRGFHLSFEHAIAIKCLKVPGHFTEEARRVFFERFRTEGKLLSRLSEHRSIVRVYDFGLAPRGSEEVPYLVLEWLEGRDLSAWLEQRRQGGLPPLAEREALELLRPAVDAIALAHQLGVAHRDLKPANLFLAHTTRADSLKVLDFGIAKAMQEGETATQLQTRTSSGFGAFSPAHGAPEQFRSKRFGNTGPWTDVHALGLILTELCTFRRAYAGDEVADFFEASMSAERPTPRRLGAEVSDSFEALCERALALKPKERFANAQQLLEAIDARLAADAPAVKPAVASSPTATAAPRERTEPMDQAEPLPTVPSSPLKEKRPGPAAASAVTGRTPGPALYAVSALAIVAALAAVAYIRSEASEPDASPPPAVDSALPPVAITAGATASIPAPVTPASATASASAAPAVEVAAVRCDRCEDWGWCTPQADGECIATSAAHCQRSWDCTSAGKCTLRGGACVAASDGDCASSLVCRDHAFCCLAGEGCDKCAAASATAGTTLASGPSVESPPDAAARSTRDRILPRVATATLQEALALKAACRQVQDIACAQIASDRITELNDEH